MLPLPMLRFAAVLLLLAGCAEAQPEHTGARAPEHAADSLRTTLYVLPLGDSTVTLAVHEAPGGTLNALVLHDDENTAVEAGRAFVETHGGRLAELRAQGTRNVAFTLGGQAYRFDPNRMFSQAGIRRTLEAQSTYTPEAAESVRAFADALLARFRPDGVLVTLHNNTPGGYSARSYAQGGEYERDAETVHLEAGADPDDFFFVTREGLFDRLRAAGFTVVLQDNARVTDDGSLSVLAAQHGWPYVNVEAEHGPAGPQRAMIEALARLLAAD